MQYDQTVKTVNDIIAGYTMSLTLRQIYYRLVAAGLIPNRRSSYNSLSSQLVTARERGEVDENRIVDRSRRIDDFSFDTPEDFLAVARRTLERRYVRRFWDSQPVYVEVWVEKDALSQVIADAVYPYNTIVAPSKGYSSYTYLKDASNRMARYSKDKAAFILHFGDHDPSGLDMSRDLQARLDRYYGAVEIKRIALTYDQVQQYSLIPNPTKLADPRSAGYISHYGQECWELDAIEPNELVRLCREGVESEITDWDAWEELKSQDQSERAFLMQELKKLGGDKDHA